MICDRSKLPTTAAYSSEVCRCLQIIIKTAKLCELVEQM